MESRPFSKVASLTSEPLGRLFAGLFEASAQVRAYSDDKLSQAVAIEGAPGALTAQPVAVSTTRAVMAAARLRRCFMVQLRGLGGWRHSRQPGLRPRWEGAGARCRTAGRCAAWCCSAPTAPGAAAGNLLGSEGESGRGHARIRELVKTRAIPPEELRDFTIVLSNFGVFAGRYATPVVVPPWNRFASSLIPSLATHGFIGISGGPSGFPNSGGTPLRQAHTTIDPIDWARRRNPTSHGIGVRPLAAAITKVMACFLISGIR